MKIRGEFFCFVLFFFFGGGGGVGEGVHVHVDWVLLEKKNIEIKLKKILNIMANGLDRYLIVVSTLWHH